MDLSACAIGELISEIERLGEINRLLIANTRKLVTVEYSCTCRECRNVIENAKRLLDKVKGEK